LLSDQPLPDLRPGLHEADSPLRGSRAAAASAPGWWAPPPAAPPSDDDRRAVALAGRLLDVEARTIALRGEIFRLQESLASGTGHTGGSFFDVPRIRHGWPLAETPARPPATLGLYERRPDDAVIEEATRGEHFMAAHGLLGEAPDFAAAVAALNAAPPVLRIDPDRPDVSVVIPVYGQFAYTLNTIDSLLRHRSRYSMEIIIVDDCSPDGHTAAFTPQIQAVRYHLQPKNGGFIKSCNSGGELARGRFVLMLNSDTRVVDGWLDAILDSFDQLPNAGLVGSKMLYPDGTLQEAGGILWRDGGAWNYGRGDDPNRPQYCYARQVDYISGCSIALPTPLWRDLGGFDPHYTPAYAEDADLCQRVLARGLNVWFQPLSRVVHYEGKTSGTSTSGGIKAYQVINLKKLFLRWRQRFETHRTNAEAPFFERERDVRKRMLFVDAVTPTPNQDAGSVQTVLGMACAQACGYKVSFVPEDNWLYEPGYTPDLQRAGIDCTYAPFEVSFEDYIRRYGWLFDVVLVYRVGILSRCLPLIRQYAPQALVLFHVADLHYLRARRQATLDGSDDGLRAAEELKERELDLVRASDCTITHSTYEAEILAEEVPEAEVNIWPLMFEFFGTRTRFDQRRDICFLGGYRHPPNVDAVQYFVREVLPLIHAQRPDIRFIVAGANPSAEILALASESVIVTGMVDNLADVFDDVRVFVCPLRVGAGAKGKVMSALSYGLPIVSTPVGVEGAGLVPGEHVLTAETPADFAATVLRLYGDEALWNALSTAGQALIKDEFSLGMGARQLEQAVDQAYRHKLGLVAA
jgi:GT2 family glycosyltransferase/glycosyltransferase involved in cell wall biosynthesis